jgi:CRISPR/Cas system-associated protein Csm6
MFCPWCDFKDYCDTYKSACEKSEYKFLSAVNYSPEQLLSEWNTVRDTKKILEERERELAMIIIEKIKMTGANLISGDDELYIRQNARTNYDLETVYRLVSPDDFKGLVNLNKKAVSDYLDANPAVKEEVESSAQANYTTPFLAVKKIKN